MIFNHLHQNIFDNWNESAVGYSLALITYFRLREPIIRNGKKSRSLISIKFFRGNG